MFFLRDGLLQWGPEWPRRSKTKKTRCFSLLVLQKSRKLDGFAFFFVPPATTSPGSPSSPGGAEPGRAEPRRAEPGRAEPSQNPQHKIKLRLVYAKKYVFQTSRFEIAWPAPLDRLAGPSRGEPTHFVLQLHSPTRVSSTRNTHFRKTALSDERLVYAKHTFSK